MTERVSLDNLIRRSMHEAVDDLEPSAGVREALLAAAQCEQETATLSVGPMIPPLANGLREPGHLLSMLGWREKSRDHVEPFGPTQQGQLSLWLLTMQTRY